MENEKENIEEFDYESMWNKQEEKVEKKLIEALPQGLSRNPKKGKWLRKKPKKY